MGRHTSANCVALQRSAPARQSPSRSMCRATHPTPLPAHGARCCCSDSTLAGENSPGCSRGTDPAASPSIFARPPPGTVAHARGRDRSAQRQRRCSPQWSCSPSANSMAAACHSLGSAISRPNPGMASEVRVLRHTHTSTRQFSSTACTLVSTTH